MAKSFLSGKKVSRANLNFFRVEVSFGAAFIFFIVFFSSVSESFYFSKTLVYSLAGALLLLFLLSFFINSSKIKYLRFISYSIYFSGVVYAISLAYNNHYNLETYSVLMIVYLFYLITLYDFKDFLKLNSILVAIVIFSLIALKFNTEIDVKIILFSLGLLTAFGAISAYSRKFATNRVKKREQLLEYMFNNSSRGFILLNAQDNTVIEINDLALEILAISDKNEIKLKKINEFELENTKIFKKVTFKFNISKKLSNNKLITIKRKDFTFNKSRSYLLEINCYTDKKSSDLSEELEKVKLFSEENYENLFKESASFICIIDREGYIIDVNNTISKALGYPRSEIIGKKQNTFDVENYNEIRQKIDQKAWNGERQIFEKQVINKEGKIIEIEVILTKGKYLGKDVLISNSRDISLRKALEKKVKARTKIYKNLIENSSIAIIFTDLNGNLLEFNDSFLDLLEWPIPEKEQLRFRNIDEITDKSTWTEEKKNIAILLENKKTSIETEKQLITKNQTIKHVLLKYMLHPADDEGEEMILHQIVDITPIVDTRNKLIESENSYKNLFNDSNELLYAIDRSNKFIDINKRVLEKYGYAKEEIIGKDPSIFAAPGKNDLVEVNNLLNLAWQGEVVRLLWWSMTKEGNVFPKDLIIRKAIYFGKEVLIASGRDISKQYEYENKLVKSEKKYKDLIDSSTWGIVIFKGEKIVFANKKAAELAQVSISELVGKNRIDFITDELEIKNLNKRIYKVKAGRDLPLKEVSITTGKNEKLKIELKAKAIEYEGNECILVSFIDIRDRQEIEEARKQAIDAKSANRTLKLQLEQNRQAQIRLRNAQSYSEGVVESSLDMIFTTDVNGNLTKLNRAAKNKLGIEESDYFMKSFQILFENKEIIRQVSKALDNNKSYTTELLMCKKNGDLFTVFVSFSHLYTADNTFLGIMGISRDITEIKRKEREINEQAAKLNAIIESSSHFFFTVNKAYLITSFNSHFKEECNQKYGVDIEINDSFFKLFENLPEVEKRELSYFWNRNLTNSFSGKTIEFEMENSSEDGNLYFRAFFLNPIYTSEGDIEEVSGIGHDTTDKRLYEKELKKSLAEKEVLLQEVHHRVKNNMQVISSILNLQSAHINDKKLISILNESQDRIRAMANIHERLYRTKNFSDIKFSDYIKDLAENSVNSYEYGEAVIELMCEIEEIFLTLDISIPCGLIVNELISNALKYAFEGRSNGKIILKLYQINGEVSIILHDDGVGIAEEVKLKNSETLGLQLVNTLVEQIEGTVDIIISNGTKFHIKFRP